MKRKFTSLLSLALLCAMGVQAQDLTAFQTLPTEVGKGVVTSLRDNGRWVAYKQAPGYNLGEATWAQFNNPWGGNGRVYLECAGQAEDGNYLYIIAGQGQFITGFAEDTAHGNVMRPTVGPKAQAYKFEAEREETIDDAGAPKTILRFKDPASGQYLFADGANGNNILSLAAEDPNGWEIGTWRGVTFARLDVKPYNGDATGTAIKACYDGYFYGTLCLPFAVIVPDGNDTQKYPNIANGNKVVNVWKLSGYGDDIQVTPVAVGDTVPGGTPIFVRATGQNVDFPYDPTSTYVDVPPTDGVFSGFYTVAPEGEQYQLTIDAGYPKFERANVMVDKNNTAAGHEGEMRQAAVNLGYIVSNNDNGDILEYRFNFDDMTLKGYENPDYKTMLEANYGTLLHQAGTEPFGINPADTTKLIADLAALGDDITEDQYNAYLDEINKSYTQPDEVYLSLKNGGALGDRGEANRKGLFANFGTPNGANGRIYMKKVADGQYQVGVNGRWIQAPKAPETGVDENTGADVTETYQVDLGTDPVTFDVNVVAPGQITISKDDIALASGGDGNTIVNDETTTNKGGAAIGAPLYTEDADGNQQVNTAAIWSVNAGFTNRIRLDAADAAYTFPLNDSTNVTRHLGTICEPYAIAPDLDADASAKLFQIVYDKDDNLQLNPVATLEAGEPGIISTTKQNYAYVNILNGFVTAPKAADDEHPLIGILNFSTMPADGQYANPHFLGTATTTSTVGEGDDAQEVPTTSLVFTESTGKLDINKAFIDFGSNAEDVPVDVAALVTGIKNINTNANTTKLANDAIYNLAGQRVGKDYKGIVIKNGKKYINK